MSDININILGELDKDPFVFTPQPDVFRVSFTTSNDPFRLRRIHKLAQIVAKVLLTTRGTDSFRPDIGTGIRSLIGQLVSKSNLSHLQRDIALWVSDAEKQLKEEQEEFAFPLDERVERLDLLTADFDFETLTWTIRVQVTSEAGIDAVVNVGPQVGPPADDVESAGVRDVLTLDNTPIP